MVKTVKNRLFQKVMGSNPTKKISSHLVLLYFFLISFNFFYQPTDQPTKPKAMAYPMRSNNFQRSQSKVWFGSSAPMHSYYDDYFSLPAIPLTTTKTAIIRSTILEQNESSIGSPDVQNESNASGKSVRDVWNNRQGSPSSHKSQVSFLHFPSVFNL